MATKRAAKPKPARKTSKAKAKTKPKAAVKPVIAPAKDKKTLQKLSQLLSPASMSFKGPPRRFRHAFKGPVDGYEPSVLPDGLSFEQVAFLRKYEETGNKSRAAAAARVHRSTVYDQWLKEPKFKRAYDDVREAMLDGGEQCLSWAARIDWKAALALLERERPVGQGGEGEKRPQTYVLEPLPKPSHDNVEGPIDG